MMMSVVGSEKYDRDLERHLPDQAIGSCDVSAQRQDELNSAIVCGNEGVAAQRLWQGITGERKTVLQVII